MLVTVANGAKTTSTGICQQFQWTIRHQPFYVDFRLLPLGGCDLVLGEDWLRILGDITFNLAKLSISFLHNGQELTLQGTTTKPSLMMINSNSMKNFIRKNTPALVGQFFLIHLSPTPPEVPTLVKDLLNRFVDVFEEPTQLPPQTAFVQEILKNGIIQDSHSPFASPILLVKKKDNTWRFCVDYSKLNAITIKDKFHIPVIDELLDELHGSKVFTKLDLRDGYHKIRVHHSDIHKTTFRTHQGHYEFQVMSFGLTNAPVTFQALINSIFGPYLRKFVLVFFDYILVYIPNLTTHEHHLSVVLSLLREYQLYVKYSKCCFSQSSLEYLGHIITAEGVAADLEKIAWYYISFIKGYDTINKPLTDLLKKNAFIWSPLAEESFFTLKTAMCTTPVLALPDFSKRFVVETDACSRGIGEVLMQGGRVIAYYSKPLGPKALGLSTYEKELLVVFNAVTKWKHYLTGHHFIIDTDQRSINLSREYIQKIDVVLDILKDTLHKSQERMKWFADKKRTDRSFEVGDLVYLKLYPYRHSSIALRKNFKLYARYYGPFPILQRVGQVSYKLEVPSSSKIHPVFHVSQLKKKIGVAAKTSPSLLLVDSVGEIILKPLATLDSRQVFRQGQAVQQLLIQWSQTTPAYATWEDLTRVTRPFSKISSLRTRVC
ncbi:uncharacterized protein LOC113305656 [Papaver somniferum]|uniref:uncharacterized protein LOC113305656 n=1 Tax=Papaver somniferum TaxID=3469 RepID=UPI000E6FB33C|nr:uncharacterized protein LOC113305656 [Papaver somniferum]